MFFFFHTNLLLRRNMHFPQHNVLPKTQHLVTLGQLVNEIVLPHFEPI